MSARGHQPLPEGDDVAICGAPTWAKDRHPCGLPAGWGTDHVGAGRCSKHGGRTNPAPPVNVKKLKAEARVYGERKQIDPYSALLAEVEWSAGHCEWLRNRVQERAAWRPRHGCRCDRCALPTSTRAAAPTARRRRASQGRPSESSCGLVHRN